MQQQRRGGNGGLWNSIMYLESWDVRLRNTFQKGHWMRVGDGRNTKFWEDKWIGDSCLRDRIDYREYS